jgi:hypothetical protein
VIYTDTYRAVWISIQFYSDYEVSESSMYNDWILKAPQVVLRMGNIYDPIQVSTDEYLKILTEQDFNRESSKTRREIIFADAQENHSQTIPTHTDKYNLVLNSRSLCTESVITNLLLPIAQAAARHL